MAERSVPIVIEDSPAQSAVEASRVLPEPGAEAQWQAAGVTSGR